jgi:hypothetical protein
MQIPLRARRPAGLTDEFAALRDADAPPPSGVRPRRGRVIPTLEFGPLILNGAASALLVQISRRLGTSGSSSSATVRSRLEAEFALGLGAVKNM